MAQKKTDYAAGWKNVLAFENKGLPKSALAEVMKMYAAAEKENNMAQLIKTAMYQVKYRGQVEEDSRENNIFFVDTLIAKAKAPVKNILQSMQAEMFWSYVQNNRWKLYSRTQLAEEKSKDITTWSIDKLHSVISQLYGASLQNESLLKNTAIGNFDDAIEKGKNTRNLRPTLFDFLAHRALAYYVTDERDLTRPAYKFLIDDPKAMAPASEFINTKFITKDTASLQHKALLLFQDLLRFHLNDAKPEALIDADIIRIAFVYNNATFTDKEKAYEKALQQLENRYPSAPASAQAAFLRGMIYYQHGETYEPFAKIDQQYEKKRAKELFESIYTKFPKSEGGISAKNQVTQMMLPTLNLETEKVNLPQLPYRTLVKYKNVKKLYFRIIKTSREEIKKQDRRDYDQYWKALTQLKPLKSWDITLPDLNDYQEHAVEVKMEPAELGTYMVLASLNADFSLAKNIVAKQVVYISNISYIHNSNNEYFVLHRDKGTPLPGANVQIWESGYNYSSSSYEDKRMEQYTADKNGYFKMKTATQYRNYFLQVKLDKDELFLDDNNYYNYYNSYTPELKPQTFLFTDRSIYRPGQTLYFKGIVLRREKDAAKSVIMPGFKTTLILRDANAQKVSDLVVTTNAYGSYNGSFRLPEGVLNGNFSLFDESTNTNYYFSVEEYKRPKFFVEVEKPKGTYRVNDSITVTGNAKAYAGNNIDGAKVSYRVVRKVRYPIWWEWGFYRKGGGRGIAPSGKEEMEITNGITTTNADGTFKVTFKAIPDESVDKAAQPIFYYEVSADVNDINGETRSGETTVAVAYQSLQISINTPDKLPADSLKQLLISSTNLNDIFESAKVNVTLHKLKSPGRIFRSRLWDMPDQFVMSKEEYYNNFPYDVYKDEDKQNQWPVGDKVVDRTDTTAANNKFPLGSTGKLSAGWYKIIVTTKDKYGETVKAEKYIQLTDISQPSKEEPVIVDVQQRQAEPGEKLSYVVKTGFDNVWLIHSISKMNDNTAINYPVLNPNNNFYNNISVSEADRGGMSMSYAFVQHGRVYKGSEYFSIPWSNKELKVEYTTFRDKLLPGSQEKWTVKISGSKGEKVNAELLASMYDASLDQFKPHNWSGLDIWPGLYNVPYWMENSFNTVSSDEHNEPGVSYLNQEEKSYDALIGAYLEGGGYGIYTTYALESRAYGVTGNATPPPPPAPMAAMRDESGAGAERKKKAVTEQEKSKDRDDRLLDSVAGGVQQQNNNTGNEGVQVRKNFNETAFFFPDLTTDADGNVSFSFTMPEALTKWKLMTLAHNKDLASGYSTQTVVTQKELMVQPNAPRFMREGDQMEFSAKIVNLTNKELTGTAHLELLDATTNKPVDGWFKNVFPSQYFTVAAGQSQAVRFPMEIPFNFNSAMSYRIVAKAENFSDGEEMAIPILTNRMLVTETLPLNLRNQTSKNFSFAKLLSSGNSTTLTHQALTVEYTSNPAWYAVQALPYLMEYPYECAEQTFNRYYANTLATFISNSTPKIKAVFDRWKTLDTAALQSNLEKNQELKSALLEETPWVLAAQNENQQKKNIALLFDMVKMSNETMKAFNKLREMQSSNGGFTWFRGGPDDRYITQYIITGIGHLRKLNALTGDRYTQVKSVVDKGIPYLDKKIKEEYDNLIKYKAKLADNHLSYTAIQYLYMRSFFSEYKVEASATTAYNYYTGQAKKYWLSQSKYMQAMIALALHRGGDAQTPKNILKSLRENSISKEEMGMYWKDWASGGGYYWYQAPVESQAMMIEAFADIEKNTATVDDMKTWLLKQKQTQNWKTTKATAEACYALLLGGSNWLAEERTVTVNLGGTIMKGDENAVEAGTGYFKKSIKGEQVKPAMGNISVSVQPLPGKTALPGTTSWGAVYWQYFEDLDKITVAETPLKLSKKLFVEKNSDKGPVLTPVGDGAQLKVGDKVKVRIELRVDRDMEYVHMKDMRAACMEPVNVLSEYKWQGGLGYYESTKDASTNFFFSWLPRGTYVFEYPVFVTHKGNFSNGISSIQCMYAPEFSSHSEGIRVNVE